MKETGFLLTGELQVNGLTKRFGGLTALSDISFSLEDRKILGIIGPNGAGKTTLFNIISGFLQQDQGRMTYEGTDLSSLKPHQIVGLGIARTFQIVKPFKGMTVFENTMVAALSHRSRRARPKGVKTEEATFHALERASLIHRKDDYVDGLPQGDLRRLEIARALATYPRLLLLDEPFSGLSLKEMDDLAEQIQDLNEENCSILLIEHKLKVVMALAQRIIVLDFGRLIADGTPGEIAENEKVIQAYLGRRRKSIGET